MTVLTLSNPSPGTLADANVIASNNNAILAVVNGNLDDSNIKAAAAIAASKLAGYPSDATKFLRGDGSWAVVSSALSLVTSLPGSPPDGQEVILTDSLTNSTFTWRLRYNAGSANTDKWEYLGGVPIRAAVTTTENVTSASYVDAATVVSVTVPRAGVYAVQHGALISAIGNGVSFVGLKVGAGAAVDSIVGGNFTTGLSYSHPNLAAAASDVIKQQYHVNTSGTQTQQYRWMSVTPVRVS